MTHWPDLEAALQGRPGWRRVGREYHGPCPVSGAGRDWCFASEGRAGDVALGCRKCGGNGGKLDSESFLAHLAALGGETARHVAAHATNDRRRHRGARDGAQWPGRARVRTDGARRVHHGSHAGRQLENRPHGRSLLGGRDRRTRGRRTVFVKAGTGGRHDSTTASREHHSGMNSRWRVTGSRTVEPQQHHVNTTALRRIVPPMRQGCLVVLLARRVSDRAHLFSRGVRHVRQILNPLRDIRHALNRRDVHAERPSRPEKVWTIIRLQEVMRPRGERSSGRGRCGTCGVKSRAVMIENVRGDR